MDEGKIKCEKKFRRAFHSVKRSPSQGEQRDVNQGSIAEIPLALHRIDCCSRIADSPFRDNTNSRRKYWHIGRVRVLGVLRICEEERSILFEKRKENCRLGSCCYKYYLAVSLHRFCSLSIANRYKCYGAYFRSGLYWLSSDNRNLFLGLLCEEATNLERAISCQEFQSMIPSASRAYLIALGYVLPLCQQR